MPNYNFLPNNESEFPHISNVNVYQYDNELDYSRYDYTQMELQICTVPWDMGEAHIGNRTISGIGNVVYFGSRKKRDEWFDAIPDSECYRFETKFKELHRDHVIDVPVPYDMCAKHNYLVVRYALFANDDSPVMYEGNDGLREWFWFIREVEFVAPNTTRLHLLDDAFQTWIYDVTIQGMILERGHAPMFETSASEFLADPIHTNEYLLTEDVNFGEASQVRHIDAVALNYFDKDTYACIATTANINGTWGSKANDDWQTPAAAYYETDGVPSVYVFAVKATDLDTFLTNITASYPQFKQTVQGVFFASDILLTVGTAFTFADVSCYPVSATRKTIELLELQTDMFGYPSRYAGIAKLYTSPYAHIEVTDENGNVDIIKIEDTTGSIDVSAVLSIAYPFVNVEAHLLGVGGDARKTVTFKNITEKTFDVSGQWYETLRSWKVPTFAVVLDAATEYDYATHFDRAQRVVDYTTAYDNATASNATAYANSTDRNTVTYDNTVASDQMAYDNATDSANTASDNANESAGAIVDNANAAITANSATVARSNTSAYDDLSYTQTYNSGVATADNILIGASASSTIAANEQQAAIATGSGVASAAVGTIGSIASLDVGGAITSVANGVIGAATTMANTNVAIQLESANATYAEASNSAHATASNTKSQWQVDNQANTNTDISGYQNTLTGAVAATNSAALMANAARTLATETGNATRTQTTNDANALATKTVEDWIANRVKDTNDANATRIRTQAQSAIENDIAQAALRDPLVYGNFANGDSATTKPMALFAHIVTQSRSAIASAGDEMLRYGYMVDKQWKFDGNWNVCKHFTYWKLRDFWVTNLNVPDMYMDKLRFFLFGGVTVWRNPDDIGKITIYENFAEV